MTLRTVRAVPGAMGDAVALATRVTHLINERHGADFSISIPIGGDPDMMAASAPWTSVGAYQTTREAYMADTEIRAHFDESAQWFASTQDQIVRVLAAPGDRAAYTSMNRVQMRAPRITEAIPLALEVCEFVEDRVGLKLGFATAFTGSRTDVGFFAHYDSLNDIATIDETLGADPEYLDFFKRGGDLYVDGSHEHTIWQRVS